MDLSQFSGDIEQTELSSVTDNESLGTMEDYDLLKDKTRKLKIIETEHTESVKSSREELSDEFLRNFFIKFGMKKTLNIFSQEWFEKTANGDVDKSDLPEVPPIFLECLELTD